MRLFAPSLLVLISATTLSAQTAADFRVVTKGLPADSQGWGGVAFGDVNGDGVEDLAAIARLGNGPCVFLCQRDGSYVESSSGLAGLSGRSDVAFGDFNGDGKLDIAAGTRAAWLGNGGGSWTPAQGISPNWGGYEGVAVADVNADGFDDVAVSGHFIGFVHVYLADGMGGFSESSSGLPNKTQGFLDGGHKLLLQDLTDDGKVDLVWTRYYSPNVWAGDGKGSWTAGSGLGPHQCWGVDAGDVDGDGKLELVFGVFDLGQGRGGGGIQVYKRTGSNAWSLQAGNGLPTSGSVQDIALADFDRDGNLDVVAGSYSSSGSLSFWRGSGKGSFSSWSPAGAPTGSQGGSIEGVAVGDIDGDTFPEVAYTVYGKGVIVLRNERTGFSLYGKACSGTHPFPPQLGSAGGLPKLGNSSFAWTLKGPASRSAIFCLGASRRTYGGQLLLPLDLGPIGAPGCALYTEPIFSRWLGLGGSGSASVPMGIPSLPVLFQYSIFGQGAVLVPGANALQLLFTEGGAVRIGR